MKKTRTLPLAIFAMTLITAALLAPFASAHNDKRALVTIDPPAVSAQTPTPARPSVYQTTLEEPNQITPEIATEELQYILATNSEPVFDVRTAREYSIAHIPGTVNVFEKEVERITELYPDRTTRMILYCNGPACGKSKRTSEQLVALGYTNVRRYQLGIPVWRALSQTVQTDIAGFDYIFRSDHTAVFVDARTPSEFNTATLPGAVNIQAGEATAANDDGRLPLTDKGTRVVVFANSAQAARTVAAEIAKKAYWNSSYFGGTFADLEAAGYINHPPTARAKNITVSADGNCLATITSEQVDDGSSDPDSGDRITLSLDHTGPFSPGGPYQVTLTATDSRNASSSAQAAVTVVDTTAPNLAAPVSITAYSDISCQAAIPNVRPQVSASDSCGPVTLSQSPAAGTLVGAGTHGITVTATDGSTNSRSATTTFTVIAVPSFTVSVNPTTVRRGGRVTLNAGFRNCASSRQTVWLKVGLTSPTTNNLMVTLPVTLQAGQAGSLSIPLTIPGSTPTGLYSLRLEVHVEAGMVGTSTAQLTVTP